MRTGKQGKPNAVSKGDAKGQRYFGYSLRTPRWRFTQWNEGELGVELYDHQHDVHELTNLAERDEHRQTIQQLSEQLKQAVATTFPKDGTTPVLRDEFWAPNLTDP
jgi:iduronate 2-sulfatase